MRTGQGGNGFKLTEGRFRVEILHSEGSGALAQLPREAVVPHTWRCLRLGWMKPWAD